MEPKNFDCYEKSYAQYALDPIECLQKDPRGYLQYVFYCEKMACMKNELEILQQQNEFLDQQIELRDQHIELLDQQSEFNLQRAEFLEAEVERRRIQNIEGENRKMRTVMGDCFREIRSMGDILAGRTLDSPENQRIRQVAAQKQARIELEAQEQRQRDAAEQQRLKLKLEYIRIAKYQELTPGVTYISDTANILEEGEIVAPFYEEVVETVQEVIAKPTEVIEQLTEISISVTQNDLITNIFKQFLEIENNLYSFCDWAYRKICLIFK